MQATIYYTDDSVLLQFNFEKAEQFLEIDKIEIEASVQSNLKIIDNLELKKALITLSKCFEIPEKSDSMQNI